MSHNPQNPLQGNTSFVDKLIGNSYEVVKYVAYYVKEIRYVAFNMEHVYRVSQDILSNAKLKTQINALDTTYEIELPVGISAQAVLASSVLVTTIDNEVYGPSVDTFSWIITDGVLLVTVPSTAPIVFIGAEIRWLVTWNAQV